MPATGIQHSQVESNFVVAYHTVLLLLPHRSFGHLLFQKVQFGPQLPIEVL